MILMLNVGKYFIHYIYSLSKPANGAMGNGIHLIQNLEKISVHDHIVVQEYLDKPLIVEGKAYRYRL